MSNNRKYEFGKPISPNELPKPRRLKEYDKCLREFIGSGHTLWQVNIEALPSNDIKKVLSSLKWRIKNRAEFKGKNIKVFMRSKKIYLERETAIG